MHDIKTVLEGVKNGSISVDEAVLELKKEPFYDMDFAKIDLHRSIRQGNTEVIYAAGKTVSQILAITDAMQKKGQDRILENDKNQG